MNCFRVSRFETVKWDVNGITTRWYKMLWFLVMVLFFTHGSKVKQNRTFGNPGLEILQRELATAMDDRHAARLQGLSVSYLELCIKGGAPKWMVHKRNSS